MKQTKVNNLQALRAFAATSVVLFHTAFHFPVLGQFGSYGVDVFFVLSGYVMARICETNADHFFQRRVLRIVPPYWAMTLFLFFLALWMPDKMNGARTSVANLVKSLFFIPYVNNQGDLRPLLFVGWSLNFEMCFYVLIAVSLLLWRRHVLLLSSALILGLRAVCSALSARHWAVADFFANDATSEFICGFIVYEVARRVRASTARRLLPLSLATALLAAIGLMLEAAYLYPHLSASALHAAMMLLASLLLLGASLLSQGGWDTKLAWVVLLGDASYVLYLIHPFLELSLDRLVAPRLPRLHTNQPLGCLLSLLLSVAAALLAHVWLERPTISFLNKRFGGKRPSAEMSAPRAMPEQVTP